MPRDVFTVETGSRTAGLNYTENACVAANGAQYDNINQNAELHFRNTTAGAVVVTVSTDKLFSPEGAGLTSKTYTVPASSEGFIIPPLTNQWWAQDGTTNVYLDFDVDGLQLGLVARPA
ncbi:hypothetical protein [Neptunomonas sp.]|uniref:hypothetical protein n=1 Tax=Neptunomonas sp. TaxID=1971898 RepID=UPI0035650701